MLSANVKFHFPGVKNNPEILVKCYPNKQGFLKSRCKCAEGSITFEER
jgi:hypothetical protein